MKNSTTNISSKNELSVSSLKASLDSLYTDSVQDLTLVPLDGDASTRRYYRLSFRKPNGVEEKLVVTQLESPQPGQEPDYVNLTRILEKLHLPVPRLYRYDDSTGLLLIEDCGDTLLWNVVRAHNNTQETRMWYEKAVTLLVHMQRVCKEHIGPDCPAYHLRFDVEKLMWEFDFMLTHFVEGLNKTSLSSVDRNLIRNEFEYVCTNLAQEETCFTHRDYHSRNIMIKNDALKIIDFQDARMGPCQYDLVSLLRDSYVELDENLVCDLIEFYIRLVEGERGKQIDRKRFRRTFNAMAVQRNLKAVGTFAYQKVVRGTDRYLNDIPRTLSYVKKTLEDLPELSRFRILLGHYIPEILSS